MNRLTAIGLVWELNAGKNILVVGRSRVHTRDMFEAIIYSNKLKPPTQRISRTNGAQCIEHVNGSYMRFLVPEPGVFRGLSPDIVYVSTTYLPSDLRYSGAMGAEVIWE